MILATLLALELLALMTASYAQAASLVAACRIGNNHCIFTPADSLLTTPVVIRDTVHKLVGMEKDKIEQGTYLFSPGAGGSIQVTCKKSAKLETFFWFFDQEPRLKGESTYAELGAAKDNTRTAQVRLGGLDPVYGETVERSTEVGIDVTVSCPP
ncbi:hypothetical protein BDZ90DRAFT_40610 [Jaminaea rosea]|uniref:Uncharacterized protein n=1 Tax=Jaminaea rosea TaxID=1569628 RepID=A0A316UTV8_9BASI|nr:hypothetical protein BDZ90DRAFT_40610 [Jaminaea rosea]PWN26525.1 hypothetical protein BDZ90DRAFT_40610 [Jaminaea rosea]